MKDFHHLQNWNHLAPQRRDEIKAGLFEGKYNPGLKSLCGAASTLALKEYVLFKAMIELAIALEFPPEGIYEGILQCYLFLGFPRSIEGLRHLAGIFKRYDIGLVLPRDDSPRNFEADGHKLCRIIYGQKYSRLMEVMSAISPELTLWMIQEGYGKVLSRPGLTAKERELVTVAALVPEGVPNQLASHIRGALNAGAVHAEIIDIINFVGIWVDSDSTAKAISLCES